MTALMARLSALATVALVVVAIGVLWVTSSPGLSGTPVRAEFRDAYPLLPGMYVRVSGAIAGTVANVELDDEGHAVVTMQLNEGTEPPRADATAAIRQQDITGDSYVALEPGDDPQPLGEAVIPTARTLVSPRFDDLLNSFDEPTRVGLEMTLVELGKALESRGADLNAAALELRPGLEAANAALGEVRSQNAALAGLVADAETVTGQAASRAAELDRLISSLAVTTRTLAAEGPALDAALEVAPQTAAAAERTLGRLAAAARAAQPLARTLESAAPDLALTATLLGPFLADTRAVLTDIGPTLRLVRRVLRAGTPTLEAAPRRVVTAPFDLAASVGALLDLLLGDPELARGLFGADGYGQGERSLDDLGLGSVGVERGDQAGYEGSDPDRRFLRAVAIPTCEMFGREIEPGCLVAALSALRRGAQAGGGNGERGAGSGAGAAGSPVGSGGNGAGGRSGPPSGLLDGLGVRPPELPGGLGGGRGPGGGAGAGGVNQGVGDRLDFLLGP